jgi:glycosyltransferase involved in cell wall biosynthesis
MKVSIITVVYNRDATIERTINSVLSQAYKDSEYIVVDGGSSDRTLGIIDKYKSNIDHFVSEKDRGIYDAINKGISLSTGEVIGLLHSDDVFSTDRIIEQVAAEFRSEASLDCLYGDEPRKFANGFMPAHTSFFCRKECFDRFGNYSLDYPISSDFDLLVRFLFIHRIKSKYIPICTTHMAFGGKSTSGWSAKVEINKQCYQILKTHGIPTNYFKLFSRYFRKLGEYL